MNLTPYIIGMSIGGTVMLLFFLSMVYFSYRKFQKDSIVKKIGQTAEDLISNDLKVWAKYTKNKFIGPALYYKNNSHSDTFEVDSVLITPKMIIVVEIKSIKGIVKGAGDDAHWYKIMERNKSIQHKIQNPVTQNKLHIKHLNSIIDKNAPIISLIVFSNRVVSLELENIPEWCVVTKHANMFDVLDDIINSENPNVILKDSRNEIYERLKSRITTKSLDRKKHIARIKEMEE